MGQFPKDTATATTPSSPARPSSAFFYQPINAWSSSGLPVTLTVSGSSGSYCQKVQGTGTNTSTWYLAYVRTSSSSSTTSSCTVTATQTGDATFNAATQVQVSVSVNRGPSNNSVRQTYTAAPGMSAITLAGGGTTLSIQTGATTTSTGTLISQALIHNLATGGSAAQAWTDCSVSTLPAGLTFGAFTCELAGSPTTVTASGTYTVTYRNPFGTSTQAFTLEVTKGNQVITFPAISDTSTAVVDFDPRATNSISVANGGEAITYRTSNAAICTIVGGKIHPVASGNCTVTASAGSNSSFNAAVDVSRTFYILGAPSVAVSNGSSADITVPVGEFRANFFPITNAGGTISSWVIKNAAGTVLTPATLPMDLIFDTATGILSGSFELSQARTQYILLATNAAGSSTINVYMTAVKIDQTITFNALNGMAVGDADQGLFATASSGLSITFTTNSASICTIVAGKVHAVAAGICTVTAAQSANSGADPTYNAAISVSRQFSVTAALTPPDISLTNTSATVSINRPLPWLFDVLNNGGKVAANGYSISPSPSTISDTATVITFDTSYGVFSGGTPNRVGTTVFTITANNSATPGGVGASTTTFTLNVVAAPDTLRISQLGDMIVGTTADAIITASAVSARTGITYSASPSNVCSLVSNKLHAVGYGTCLLAGHLDADSTWSAADASINISIHAPPKLTLTSPVALIGGTTNSRSVITQTYVGDPATRYELWDSTGGATNYTNNGILSLSFSSSTGALTGTVTSINQSAVTYRVKVTNPYGTDSATVVISVTGLTPPVISISNPDVTGYDQTYEFSDDYIISNTGQPATDYLLYNTGTVNAATLPAGLAFDPTVGAIYGTATTATPFAKTSYDLYAHNAAGNSNKVVVSLTLIDPVSITTSTTIPTASLPVAGSPFDFGLVTSGGFGGNNWSYANNTSWLTVNSAGHLVGTPPASSSGNSFSIDVTVTDSGTAAMGGPSVSPTKTYSGTVAVNNAATDVATNITATSAKLNGSTSLSGSFTNAFFCYSTTIPGTSPSNQFAVTTASRATKSCTTSLSSHIDTTTGTISPFGADISGLASNTTYYYQFFINVGGSAAGNEKTGTLKSFKTYAATDTITATAGSNGTISSLGASVVTYNANKTYTITPDSHYHIDQVLVDGVAVGTPATYTFTGINANHTIAATFAPDVYTVTFDYSSASTGLPSLTSYRLTYGDAAFSLPTLGSLSRPGYSFLGWNTANSESSANVASPYLPTSDITLYSAWTPNYAVNFDKGSGDSGSLADQVGSGTSLTLSAFSSGNMAKSGYHFGNWLSDDGSTTYSNGATISISTPFTHTLTAQWVANVYSVTYDPNGGSVDTSTATYTVGGSALTLRTPTQAGYTFNGWFTAASGGTQAPSSYSPMASITLYAQWTLKTYTVTYQPGTGATGSVITQTLSHFGSINIFDNKASTTNYSYSGKYFNGWKDAGGATVGVGSLYSTYADMTLTAQWADVAKFKVIYNPNASDVTGTIPVDPKDYLPGETATVTLRPSMTRPGYSFVGWNTNKSGTGTAYAPNLRASTPSLMMSPTNKGSLNANLLGVGTKSLKASSANNPLGWNVTSDTATVVITDNLILYAIWGPLTYTVTYNAAGGSVSPASSSFVSGSGAISLPLPTMSGYGFAGWYTAGNVFVGNANTDYTPTSDITLYAHWTANTYRIDYDANGGTPLSPAFDTFTYGGSGISLPTPTWTGHIFNGWATSASGGSSVSSPYSPSADGTLYAQWTLISYVVTYDANTGSVSRASDTWNYGDGGISLPLPTLAKYNFAGWYTLASGGSLIGHDGDLYTPASTSTIFAHWTQITYSYQVTFNSGSGGTGSQAMLAGTGVEVPLTSLSSGSIAKAGANFDFWLSDDLAGTSYSDGEVIPIDSTFIHTLTAQWADILYNYTVTFDKGTGTSGSLASKTGTGSSFSLPAFSSGTMVKPGYHFVNWISDSSTPYANLATIRIAADFVHTLIAQWAPNTSVVTYDPRGGTVDTTTATYTSGNTPLVLLTPTYTGFTFNGWYTQTNGGTRIGGAGDSYSPTDPITIYAQWTADSTPPPSGGGGSGGGGSGGGGSGGGGSPEPTPATTSPTPTPVETPAAPAAPAVVTPSPKPTTPATPTEPVTQPDAKGTVKTNSLRFEVLFGLNSIVITPAEVKHIATEAAKIKKLTSGASNVTIVIEGWVQPNPHPGNIQYLSIYRAKHVSLELKKLKVKGSYKLIYQGLGRDNLPSARHASVVVTWTK